MYRIAATEPSCWNTTRLLSIAIPHCNERSRVRFPARQSIERRVQSTVRSVVQSSIFRFPASTEWRREPSPLGCKCRHSQSEPFLPPFAHFERSQPELPGDPSGPTKQILRLQPSTLPPYQAFLPGEGRRHEESSFEQEADGLRSEETRSVELSVDVFIIEPFIFYFNFIFNLCIIYI